MLQNLLVCLTHKHAQICVKEYLQWVTGHQLSCAMVVQGFMSMVAFPLIHAYNLGQTEDSPTLFLPWDISADQQMFIAWHMFPMNAMFI